ncbi:MAG: preprotein translocase subunit SecA [Burkholderiales bacterium]|nr:preprotein translocase subunit SecA [Burkholderiales bacterium]
MAGAGQLSVANASPLAAYPELSVERPGWLERTARRLTAPLERAFASRRALHLPIEAMVDKAGNELKGMGMNELRRAADRLRAALRRDGLRDDLVAASFALVREVAGRTVGMRHFGVQLRGGWILLNGMIAEMETGEGKTLTATLPACTAALAGFPVHVITVNDYLTARDAELMRPVYAALGLSVGVVVNGGDPASRRAAYACDVTYCTNKELTFDYLRDRIALGSSTNRVQLQVEKLAGSLTRSDRLVLRGLYFAIVDEADSVLVDEARTPLIISARGDTAGMREMYEGALDLAGRLAAGEDFALDERERQAHLTGAGREKLEEWAVALPGVWSGRRRREELVTKALAALHLFHRDKQYLVHDGKIQIIDEYTGRVLADRSWELGLHQMIEAKEGVALTDQQASLARMTYQRFFRRYLRLSGMTGTASEIAGELWSVYRLPVVKVPTNRPVRRRDLGERVYASEREKWNAIARRVRELHQTGRPVLIGTRSVAASELLSALLTTHGVSHQLLNARQDKEEAEIVAQAGKPGRVTVATNMAGRGTDIALAAGVADRGGLHVIASELHESRRIDRQLFGRCARQGDPGSFEAIVSAEDELMRSYLGPVARWATRHRGIAANRLGQRLLRRLLRAAQRRAEASHARIRRDVLRMDEQLGDMLAFSGRGE